MYQCQRSSDPKPSACPLCGDRATLWGTMASPDANGQAQGMRWRVACSSTHECNLTGPWCDSREDAIVIWAQLYGQSVHQGISITLNSLFDKFKQREGQGIVEYGKTVDRQDLTQEQWLEHASDEACDLALYLWRLLRMVRKDTQVAPDDIS